MADVWKIVDKNGVTQFTNIAPGNKGELIIASNSLENSQGLFSDKAESHDASAQSTLAAINASPLSQAVNGSLYAASESFGVDYALIKAVVATESAFNPNAVSPKGAIGLMQLMPKTARRYGVQSDRGATISTKLTDPNLNIQTGTRYLADLLKLFDGKTELALAAYNAGEGAVVRAGNRIPNYKETQIYVRRVMSVYRLLQISVG